MSASISTPVTPVVFTRARISITPGSSAARFRSTATPVSGSGWHRGTRSGVRLAAMMPAMRATARASPLGRVPSSIWSTTSALVVSRDEAIATLAVTALADTSTMWAEPSSRTWVRRPSVRASS